MCEEIAIINRGELVVQESKQDLLARCPYRSLRLTLSTADYVLPESLQPLVVEAEENCLLLRLHKSEHHMGDVLKALQVAGIEVTDLRTEEAGLEEVFLELTSSTGNNAVSEQKVPA